MKKIAQLLHKLLYDNKALMVFSVILSVIIWLVVTISLSPIDTATIQDVPVSIDLANSVPAQFDLQIFGQSEFDVDVKVSGKRYLLSSVDSDSVKIVAQTAYVDSAGKHTLSLKAIKVNESDEFEIVSISQDYVEVFFDVYMEQDFPIEPKLKITDELVEEGYIAGEAIVSAETVMISGPQTEVASISKVYAEMNIDKPLSETQTQTAQINAYNNSGVSLHYLSYNYGNSDITITLPIYYVVSKPTSVSFKNAPLDYIDAPFRYTVNPETLTAGIVGADKDNIPELIPVLTVDFSQLTPGSNRFSVFSDEIPSVFPVEASTEFEVVVYVEGCDKKTLGVPIGNISFINAPEGYEVKEIIKSVGNAVTVGPKDSLADVTASDIYAVVDLTNADVSSPTQEFSAKLSVRNSTDCWVSGDYTVTVEH
ncbi:MAG: hypothetical protein IKK85_04970 [Clostridia bacterium]|nr:hypothetical protein [Clostridia bacterium]